MPAPHRTVYVEVSIASSNSKIVEIELHGLLIQRSRSRPSLELGISPK